jgi:hypothetical protein
VQRCGSELDALPGLGHVQTRQSCCLGTSTTRTACMASVAPARVACRVSTWLARPGPPPCQRAAQPLGMRARAVQAWGLLKLCWSSASRRSSTSGVWQVGLHECCVSVCIEVDDVAWCCRTGVAWHGTAVHGWVAGGTTWPPSTPKTLTLSSMRRIVCSCTLQALRPGAGRTPRCRSHMPAAAWQEAVVRVVAGWGGVALQAPVGRTGALAMVTGRRR